MGYRFWGSVYACPIFDGKTGLLMQMELDAAVEKEACEMWRYLMSFLKDLQKGGAINVFQGFDGRSLHICDVAINSAPARIRCTIRLALLKAVFLEGMVKCMWPRAILERLQTAPPGEFRIPDEAALVISYREQGRVSPQVVEMWYRAFQGRELHEV